MGSALSWDITQRIVAIAYGRFGTSYRSHLQGTINPRRNYHYTLRNVSDERRSHLLRGGSPGTAGVTAIFHRVMVRLQRGIPIGSRLRAEQCGVRIPAAARVIFPLQNVRTDSRAYQTSYSVVIGVISTGR
jgi:hypothetical protein